MNVLCQNQMENIVEKEPSQQKHQEGEKMYKLSAWPNIEMVLMAFFLTFFFHSFLLNFFIDEWMVMPPYWL